MASPTAPSELFGGMLQGLSVAMSALTAVLTPRGSPAASPPENQRVPVSATAIEATSPTD